MMEVPATSVTEQQSSSAGAEVASSNLVSTGSGESANAVSGTTVAGSSSEVSGTQLHGEVQEIVSTVGTGETSQTHTLLSTNAVQGTVFNGGTMATVNYVYSGDSLYSGSIEGTLTSGQQPQQGALPPGQAAVPSAESNSQMLTTRACPATVQWLVDNYETAEGVSLPRSTLYFHYLRHCSANKLDAVNAASFGKLIRSVFLGLRTRRLGTRGNSKYHYYGIRVKPGSPLNHLLDDDSSLVAHQQPPQQQQQQQQRSYQTPTKDDSGLGQSVAHSTPVPVVATPSSTGKTNPLRTEPPQAVAMAQPTAQQQQQFQQFLLVEQAVPNLPDLNVDSSLLPAGVAPEHVLDFSELYKEHCEELLNVIKSLQFHLIQPLWRNFWSRAARSEKDGETVQGDSNGANQGDSMIDGDADHQQLPWDVLVALCELQPIQSYVQQCDNLLYQALVDVLMPNVLRPIPSTLTQTVRNLAKNLESWLASSLTDIPSALANIKMTAVNALSQSLRRYTSLNHLAQAARAVLQNSGQITQMLNDLSKVDFASVQEQAAWVCQCDSKTVTRLQADFKETLQQQQPLEQWAAWLEKMVDELLEEWKQRGMGYVKAARQFLLKWSFYSSMVIRDLTLRSAASFGSFHLIRLLYDEYMFFVVEHRVAEALGQSPIAILGEFVTLGKAFSAQHDVSVNESSLMDVTVDIQSQTSQDNLNPLTASK